MSQLFFELHLRVFSLRQQLCAPELRHQVKQGAKRLAGGAGLHWQCFDLGETRDVSSEWDLGTVRATVRRAEQGPQRSSAV